MYVGVYMLQVRYTMIDSTAGFDIFCFKKRKTYFVQKVHLLKEGQVFPRTRTFQKSCLIENNPVLAYSFLAILLKRRTCTCIYELFQKFLFKKFSHRKQSSTDIFLPRHQIAILANHENGRDSHIRQIKVSPVFFVPYIILYYFILYIILYYIYIYTHTYIHTHTHTHTHIYIYGEDSGFVLHVPSHTTDLKFVECHKFMLPQTNTGFYVVGHKTLHHGTVCCVPRNFVLTCMPCMYGV
jgi:hypothetical protein